LESWLVDHIVIPGGPDDPACWERLTAVLSQTWQHENGAFMTLAKLAIDTGYESAAVYAWARKQGIAQVAPVKGLEGFNRATPVSGPTFVDATVNGRKLKRGARLWTVATATFKAESYRYLRIDRLSDEDRALGVASPAGTIHLPEWADSEWLKQLVAEQLVTIRNKRGYARQEWQKMRERNEALDTRIYARAAAWILGADRFDERMWRQLEKQAGIDSAAAAVAPLDQRKPDAPEAGRITAPRRRGWKISTPRYME
jgi:phage terminase large subunit GpA-like protein